MRTHILERDKYPNKYKMEGFKEGKKVFSLEFSLGKSLNDPLEMFRLTTSLEESDGISFVGKGRFDYVSTKSFENYCIIDQN